MTRFRVVQACVLGVILAVVGGVALRYSTHASGGTEPLTGPPILLLPPGTAYTPLQPSENIVNPTGRPVAHLAVVPSSLGQSTAVNINAHAGDSGDPMDSTPNVIAYEVLSSIRYMGGGQTVYVTTARASRAANSQGMRLGNQPVQLSDGSTAYASSLPNNQNQVVWQKDGVIITVAGDSSSDQITSLASRVVLTK